MSKFVSCPQCGSDSLATSAYQVRCGKCGWAVQDPDPRYAAHVEEIGLENVTYVEPIADLIAALPTDLGASLTTTRSALPASHPVNSTSPNSSSAAEFRMRRESFGVSAEWLAERFGVALKTVQRWENGHRPVPEGIVEELANSMTGMHVVVAEPWVAYLLEAQDPVIRIPRTGTFRGFPASWYRAVVDTVMDILVTEHGNRGLRAAAGCRVVYFDEVEEQK